MTEEKVDRRVQRTRQHLHEALITLILEKRYDKLTVQDILDRANIGRSTFYAHFLDKEDLLISGFHAFDDEINEYVDHAVHAEQGQEHLLHSLMFFRHAYLNRDLYRAMLDGGGADILMQTARSHITENIQSHLNEVVSEEGETAVPLPIITSFLAGAMLSVLTWWLDNDLPYTPERINEVFQNLARSGVQTLISHEKTDQSLT
jgi:AcrR family transcriptional regulator